MPLPCQRHLFDIPDEIAYLNCAYMSPLLNAARIAGQAAVARKSQPWVIHPTDFFTDAETVRTLFARLIEADADGIAIIPSVSYGIALAAANLPVRAGQNILILAEQFPSNVYTWRDVARRTGATLRTIARPPDDDWTTALLSELDEHTAVVAIPQCHWTDGSLVDLPRVSRGIRQVGAALVVDATQSLGAYPLTIPAVQPDFLVAAAYKWLLGPYSLGFLYVAPQHRAGRPLEHTWLGRAGSEDFTRLVSYRDDLQPGARQFDVGERSNFALLPIAIVALQQILSWGVPEIAATLAILTQDIMQRAAALGFQVAAAERRGSHMLGIRFPHAAPSDIAHQLATAQVFVSMRGQSMRIAPHLYNTQADIDRLFAVLGKIA